MAYGIVVNGKYTPNLPDNMTYVESEADLALLAGKVQVGAFAAVYGAGQVWQLGPSGWITVSGGSD